MTTPSNTYIPREAYQPRGKQPWCATCDTDIHLAVQSPAVSDWRTGILAVVLHCFKRRQSRVFDTTAEHITTIPPRSAKLEDLSHRSGGHLHCGELMNLPGLRAETIFRTFLSQLGAMDTLAAFLTTKVMRCRCGFQVELPR
jgi:hypothetical protein